MIIIGNMIVVFGRVGYQDSCFIVYGSLTFGDSSVLLEGSVLLQVFAKTDG